MSGHENKRRRLASPPRQSERDGSERPNEVVARSQSTMSPTRQSLGVMMPSFEAVQDLENQTNKQAKLITDVQAGLKVCRKERDADQKILDAVQETQNDIVRRLQDLEDQRENPQLAQIKAEVDFWKTQYTHLEEVLATTTNEHKQQLAHATGLLSSVLASEPKPERIENTQHLKKDSAPETPESSQDDEHNTQILLLPLLHKMDFRKPADLKALKRIEDWEVSLALFSASEKYENEAIAYSVKGRAPFADYLVPGDPKNPNKVSSFWLKDQWKDWPTILELNGYRSESITKPPFPKYVWEVGEIYNRRKVHRTNQWTEQSTGYHLVVDVTSPSKALWVVYRYVEHGDGDKLDRDVTREKTTPWHPFAVAQSDPADAAQVFMEVKAWKGTDTPVGSFRSSAELVKKTRRTLQAKPTFLEPVLEEVKQAIAKGWATA